MYAVASSEWVSLDRELLVAFLRPPRVVSGYCIWSVLFARRREPSRVVSAVQGSQQLCCARVETLQMNVAQMRVEWNSFVSKTDVKAPGKKRRWDCVWVEDHARPCPFHWF